MTVTQEHIESYFRAKAPLYDIHMPDRVLDPFQTALVAGIHEGLHAESYKNPEILAAFENPATPRIEQFARAEDFYAQDFAEKYIHNDLLEIVDALNLRYDELQWERFILNLPRHFPDMSKQRQPLQSSGPPMPNFNG